MKIHNDQVKQMLLNLLLGYVKTLPYNILHTLTHNLDNQLTNAILKPQFDNETAVKSTTRKTL